MGDAASRSKIVVPWVGYHEFFQGLYMHALAKAGIIVEQISDSSKFTVSEVRIKYSKSIASESKPSLYDDNQKPYPLVIFSDTFPMRNPDQLQILDAASFIPHMSCLIRKEPDYKSAPFILAHYGRLAEKDQEEYKRAGFNHFVDIEDERHGPKQLTDLVLKLLKEHADDMSRPEDPLGRLRKDYVIKNI